MPCLVERVLELLSPVSPTSSFIGNLLDVLNRPVLQYRFVESLFTLPWPPAAIVSDTLNHNFHYVQLFPVPLAAEFDPDGILDLHFQLPARIAECLEHIVCLSVAVISTTFALRVDDDPVISSQVERLLNGKLPENLLIAVDESILTENVRLAKDGSLFKLDRICIEFEAPVLGYLHFHEHLCHGLDLVDSFLWVDLGLHQSIAHVRTLAD